MSEVNVRPIVAEVFKGIVSEHPIKNSAGDITGLRLRYKDGECLDLYTHIAKEQAIKLAIKLAVLHG